MSQEALSPQKVLSVNLRGDSQQVSESLVSICNMKIILLTCLIGSLRGFDETMPKKCFNVLKLCINVSWWYIISKGHWQPASYIELSRSYWKHPVLIRAAQKATPKMFIANSFQLIVCVNGIMGFRTPIKFSKGLFCSALYFTQYISVFYSLSTILFSLSAEICYAEQSNIWGRGYAYFPICIIHFSGTATFFLHPCP